MIDKLHIRRAVGAILLAAALLGAACGRQEAPPAKPKISANEEALEIYNKGSIKDAIARQQQAVEDMRQGHSSEPAFAVLSQMGFFQCRAGNYTEGLHYLQEASDSLHSVSADSPEAEDAVKLLGNLSNLYTRFALYDEALRKNDEAIALAARVFPDRQADLWRMRSVVFNNLEMPDSELVCLRRSLQAAAAIRDTTLRVPAIVFTQNNKAWFFIEHPDYAPDSLQQAVNTLVKSNYDTKSQIYANLLMAGRGYMLMGDPARGIPMMEKAVEGFREWESKEQLEWGLRLLAESYASARNGKLFDIYGETNALHDSVEHRKRDDLLLGMDFKYRTSELQTRNKLLETELALTRQRIIFLTTGGVLFFGAFLAFILYRRRHHRLLMSQKEENINTLLAERIVLNSHIESLNSELADRMMADGRKDIALTPMLLEKDDETRFRDVFASLHPGFMERLRKEFPGLTPGNELLCMLIALRKTNDEIAYALGISRESVATARYRLRSRFGLPKEADLNAFILSKL